METRVEIHARAESVFRALANPASLAHFVPGIDDAALTDPEPLVGSRISLRTEAGRVIEGRILERREGRSLVVEDARGLRHEWRLLQTPDGYTVATNVIRGSFSDDRAEAMRFEAMEKIMRFVQRIEQDAGRRGGQR